MKAEMIKRIVRAIADGSQEDLERLAQRVVQAERERGHERLAGELSACPSAKDGGHLGQVSRGQTVPEFETFLENLAPGQICPTPVPTRYGVHVVRLDRRESGRQMPFELVAERIAAYLTEQAWNRGVAHYIRILTARACIQGFVFAGADGQAR